MSISSVGSPEPRILQENTRLEDFRSTVQRQETATYTDASGRSFQLTLNRSTDIRYTTYDRRALLAFDGRESFNKAGRVNLGLLFGAADAEDPIARIKKLIEELTFARHPGRFNPAPPMADRGRVVEQEHIAELRINDTIQIDMNQVDTEYWSVENTAGRLVDFAKSLYAGGNRQEHVKKMLAGMEQGYGEAKTAFGGFLPDIGRQTVNLAKEMLAEWAKEGGEAATPPAAANA